MITDNALLGKLLSEHRRGDYRRRGLLGCGLILILPFLCGLWSLIASLTYASETSDATLGFYFSIAMIVGSFALFGLFVLASYFSPLWLKKYKLEIYEMGFKLKTPFKTQTCFWTEIREVNPMLLTTPANRTRTKPSDYRDAGDTEFGGIYEVHKMDGSKILVSRQYTDVDRIDDVFKRFCKEIPSW